MTFMQLNALGNVIYKMYTFINMVLIIFLILTIFVLAMVNILLILS